MALLVVLASQKCPPACVYAGHSSNSVQFVSFKEAWGKGKGESILFDRVSNISTAGGTLTETSTIPSNNIVFSQSTLTLNEVGNSIRTTEKLETLAQFDISNPVHKALRNDMAKSIDSLVADQFKATVARYTCIGTATGTLATDGTFATAATADINLYHIKELVDQLKIWNVEPFSDGKYVCIASIQALRGVKDDTSTGAWIDANRYAGSKRLFTGEVGELMGVRFIEDTNILSNAIGNSSLYGEAIIFGQETVMEAVATPEEIRIGETRDFGRDRGVAWYGIMGWQIIWDTVDTAKGWVPRIIYVGST